MFAGVPWRGSANRQWSNRKRRFSVLSGDTIHHWNLRK